VVDSNDLETLIRSLHARHLVAAVALLGIGDQRDVAEDVGVSRQAHSDHSGLVRS
jgi:hypothetical protein